MYITNILVSRDGVAARKSTPSAPAFTEQPKDGSYTEGTSVKLYCQAKGYPRPEIQWYKNGIKLQGNIRRPLKYP